MVKHISRGVVAACVLLGCWSAPAEAAPRPRIVTFSPALTEIVFDMGLGEHVVGVTRFCILPKGETRPRVGDAAAVNAEAILSVRPDLLLVQTKHTERFEGVRQLDPHVKVEPFEIETVAQIKEAVRRIGRIVGREQLARRTLQRYESKLQAVAGEVEGRSRPRVLFVMGTERPAAAGPGSFVHDLIELAGGADAGAYVTGNGPWRQTHIDEIVKKAAAEVLICQVGGAAQAEAAERYWLQWKELPAARSGRVFVVWDPHWSIPSTRTADLASRLAEMIHAPPTSEAAGVRQIRIWQARLVRLAAAGAIGIGLAVAGMALQGLLRNPLAEPYILGISSGAGVGVMLGLAAAGWAALPAWATTPVLAFVGAVLTSGLVYLIAQRRGRLDPYSMILSGVIVNAFNGAIMLTIYLYVDPYRIADFARWGMGQIPDTIELTTLGICCGCILVGAVAITLRGAAFNTLALGDDVAASAGVAVHRLRLETFAFVALMTAAAVALAGPIGFVGLIVPHICRMIFGPEHRRLAIFSAIFGAAFLILAEMLCRRAGPWIGVSLIPVGILTALSGGPFFLVLLRRRFKEAGA